MSNLLRRLRGVAIALAALALTAGLAYAAPPPEGWGLTNASAHAGKTVPVKAGQLTGEDEDVDEDVDEVEDEEVEDEDVEEDLEGAGADGDNCATDPTGLTDEELAELKHGSIVCWAAHQTDELWGEEFDNHGQWVRSWAQKDKDDEETTEEDTVDEDAAATSAGNGRGKGQDKGQGRGNGPNR